MFDGNPETSKNQIPTDTHAVLIQNIASNCVLQPASVCKITHAHKHICNTQTQKVAHVHTHAYCTQDECTFWSCISVSDNADINEKVSTSPCGLIHCSFLLFLHAFELHTPTPSNETCHLNSTIDGDLLPFIVQ